MLKKDCFFLGKIVKKHSYKGELIAHIDADDPFEYENLESVFVELGNKLVPFFIVNSFFQKAQHLRIKFEEVENEEDAQLLLNKKLYLPLSLLPKLEGKKFYYHEVINFEVYDQKHGPIGKLIGINDQSSQHLFVIDHHGKEILIPLIDDFIIEVNRSSKTLILKTPEGLLDLYL